MEYACAGCLSAARTVAELQPRCEQRASLVCVYGQADPLDALPCVRSSAATLLLSPARTPSLHLHPRAWPPIIGVQVRCTLMALFDVPGWSMPALTQPSPSSGSSKKRKRPAAGDGPDKLQSAELNLEKLMKRLEHGPAPNAQQKGKGREKDARGNRAAKPHGDKRLSGDGERGERVSQKQGGTKGQHPQRDSTSRNARGASKEKQRDVSEQGRSVKSLPSTHKKPRNADNKNVPSQKQLISQYAPNSKEDKVSESHLTSLQSKMKQSLDGARFRSLSSFTSSAHRH